MASVAVAISPYAVSTSDARDTNPRSSVQLTATSPASSEVAALPASSLLRASSARNVSVERSAAFASGGADDSLPLAPAPAASEPPPASSNAPPASGAAEPTPGTFPIRRRRLSRPRRPDIRRAAPERTPGGSHRNTQPAHAEEKRCHDPAPTLQARRDGTVRHAGPSPRTSGLARRVALQAVDAVGDGGPQLAHPVTKRHDGDDRDNHEDPNQDGVLRCALRPLLSR